MPQPEAMSRFSGEHGESFEQWVNRLTLIMRAIGWTDNKQAETIPCYLLGRAFDAYRSLDSNIQKDLNLLVEALKTKLDIPSYRKLYRDRVNNRKQQSNESVGQFASDLSELIGLAYPNYPSEVKEDMKLNHFVRNLRPELRRKLRLFDPDTFETAYTKASSLELDELQDKSSVGHISAINGNYRH